MSNKTYTSREVYRILIIFALAFGLAMGLTGLIFDDAHAQPAEQRRQCAPDNTAPCWNPTEAYKAGVVGQTDNVPDWLHDMIKKQVRSQGDDFEQKVKDGIPWYSKAAWKIACVQTAGYRAMNKVIYFRCLDQQQMKKFIDGVGHIYLKCGATALVTGVTMAVADPGDGALKGVAALAGGVGCAAGESIDLLRWGWGEQDWSLFNGPDSASVGGGGSW